MSLDLIIKYLSGNASPHEARQLDDWKIQKMENQERFNAIAASWYKSGGKRPNIPEVGKKWKEFENKYIKFRGGKTLTLNRWAVAASIALITVCAFYLFEMNRDKVHTKVLFSGSDTLGVRLADASFIKMYPGSQLDYPETFADSVRKVKLDGQAFFKVSHDEKRHFKIDAGLAEIEVLGTEFTVYKKANRLSVQVISGVVRVSGPKNAEIITRNQEARIQNGVVVSGAITASFEFVDEPLAEVIQQLNQTFNRNIRLSNRDIGACRMSASFADEELDTLLTIIAATLNLTITKEKDAIILSGKSCK